MKFHADEHVPDAVILGLRRRGFDATTTADAALIGASDSNQIAYCLKANRVIITHDADILRLAADGAAHAGIAYCHNQKYKIGQLLSKLLQLAARVPEEQIKNRVEFL